MHRNIRIFLIFFILLQFALCCTALAGTIYYYKDENGVVHFTDLPTSSLFRPFMIFKDKYLENQEEILRLIRLHSSRYELDPLLVRAVVEIESGFESEAVSPVGAQGLMQIMPETGKELGLSTPFNPNSNIEAGVKYLRRMIDRFGTVPLALAAYNAGPTAVQRYSGIPPYDETQKYVQKVLALYLRFKEST